MSKTQDIPPKYIACIIDWSDGCDPDFLARCGGKVYLSGFYDDNVNTYICSAQKMIWVQGLELVPEARPGDGNAQDRLETELMDLWHNACINEQDSDYYPRSKIETLRKEFPENFKEVGIDLDEDEDPADQVRELLQGNPEF